MQYFAYGSNMCTGLSQSRRIVQVRLCHKTYGASGGVELRCVAAPRTDGMSVVPVTAPCDLRVVATVILLTSVVARIQALTVAGQWPPHQHAGKAKGLSPLIRSFVGK